MIEELNDAFGGTARQRGAIFIDCGDEQLEQGYTENCRPHPIAGDRPIMHGIWLERRATSTLRARAELVVDTSNLTVAKLKSLFFVLGTADLRVFIISFAYRRGAYRAMQI
jgi:RNase adapter protein RapZ